MVCDIVKVFTIKQLRTLRFGTKGFPQIKQIRVVEFRIG